MTAAFVVFCAAATDRLLTERKAEPAAVAALHEAGPGVPSPLPEPVPGAPPVEPLAALEEAGDLGPLPVATIDSSPLQTYRRVATRGQRPVVAIVVVDLGLRAALSKSSVELPEGVSLAFSTFGESVPAWQAFARSHGHETPLVLPVTEPPDVPRDAGPGALAPDASDLIARLDRLLSSGRGYPFVVLRAGAFAAVPDRFVPVATELRRRGLGVLELDAAALAEVAGEVGLAYASAPLRLDAVPDPIAVDAALGQLEATALRDGIAVAWTEAYPGVFDRIWQWQRGLETHGIDLVPASLALLPKEPA